MTCAAFDVALSRQSTGQPIGQAMGQQPAARFPPFNRCRHYAKAPQSILQVIDP